MHKEKLHIEYGNCNCHFYIEYFSVGVVAIDILYVVWMISIILMIIQLFDENYTL